ncbi:hypothetical protein D3C81_2024140 [compost metagenome]
MMTLHPQRPLGCLGGGATGHHDFAAGECDQPLLCREVQIGRAVGVQSQASAIGQLITASLAGGGGEIGVPLLPADLILAEPRRRAHQQGARE